MLNKLNFWPVLLFLWAASYLSGVFIESSFNPMEWERDVRIYVSLSFIASIMVALVIRMIWSIEEE